MEDLQVQVMQVLLASLKPRINLGLMMLRHQFQQDLDMHRMYRVQRLEVEECLEVAPQLALYSMVEL